MSAVNCHFHYDVCMSADSRFISHPLRIARAYEELASVIRDRIVSGELKAGDRIPAEAALAREAEVSRSTVREALRTLEEGGLVERVSPKIMVVRRAPDETAHREFRRVLKRRSVTFGHLHEALLVLEPELTRLATERADRSDLDALQANLDAQAACLENYGQWNQLDQEFHLAIAEMSGNPALVIARAPISDLLMPVLQRFMTSPKLTQRGLQFHLRILEEMRAGDPEAAALMARKHVNDFRIGWDRTHLNFEQLVEYP
jgi:GntR family transcriptional repressor for pyruvate dehydrogenase complex